VIGDNWNLCEDGLSHPLKWLQDNADAINATAWSAEINAWVDSLPDELVGEPQEPSGGVVFSRRYSDQPEAPLPVPAKPPAVEDDRDTLAETWRLKQEAAHNRIAPKTPASWVKAQPSSDDPGLQPLQW
jgi:hypothetical protein